MRQKLLKTGKSQDTFEDSLGRTVSLSIQLLISNIEFRPYKCEHCPKAFSNASDRAKHQNRTHSDEVTVYI